jgi:addiction module HigA family antidote
MVGELPTRRLPTHPGVIIREEYLRPLGISCAQAARSLGVSNSTLGRLLNGRGSLTSTMALLLDRYLGCPAATWLNLQHAYDLAVAIRELPPMRLQSIHPLAKIQTA